MPRFRDRPPLGPLTDYEAGKGREVWAILAGLPPEAAEPAAYQANVAERDQVAAAAWELAYGLGRLEGLALIEQDGTIDTDRVLWALAWTAMRLGEAGPVVGLLATCPHLDGRGPQPLTVPLRLPALLCDACAEPALRAARGAGTCDICEAAPAAVSLITQVAFWRVEGTVCRDCDDFLAADGA